MVSLMSLARSVGCVDLRVDISPARGGVQYEIGLNVKEQLFYVIGCREKVDEVLLEGLVDELRQDMVESGVEFKEV